MKIARLLCLFGFVSIASASISCESDDAKAVEQPSPAPIPETPSSLPPDTAAVEGTAAFDVAQAKWRRDLKDDGQLDMSSISIVLADVEGACGDSPPTEGSAEVVAISVSTVTGTPVEPGTIQIGAPTHDVYIGRAVVRAGAEAGSVTPIYADEGSVTLTDISPTAIAGSLDVRFPGGDKVTFKGAFHATPCP